MKKLLIIFCLLLSSIGLSAQMNNPYADDKLWGYGLSLGMSFSGYRALPASQNDSILSPTLRPGFSVGFISDLRMSRHLNLRLTPTFNFTDRDLLFHFGSATAKNDTIAIPSVSLSFPLLLKWSAEREKNYRPYLIGGGGIQIEFNRNRNWLIIPKVFDYFAVFGIGVDIYTPYVKICPELSYKVGLNNINLKPGENIAGKPWQPSDRTYTDAISKLFNHQLVLTINFER